MRKNISVQKGERVLDVIEQLKNRVNAMRRPVDDLLSNWAYMVMTSLAWNLKAWFGLLLPNGRRGVELIKMGVPALFTRDRFITRPDRAHGQTRHLPYHEL